ncbi:MAG: Rho termination factor N-terminal domain-containing protein, partial [Actinomycetota bacterium]|nr:Rho termination factor N-terminal domain-containing protein [Actinomycetota bacterium]
MTETTELLPAVDTSSSASGSLTEAPAKSSGLAGLKLAQLQALASQLGISGGSRMRKGDLVAAISAHRAGTTASKAPARTAEKALDTSAPAASAPAPAATAETTEAPEAPRTRGRGRSRRAVSDGVISTPAAEPAVKAAAQPAAVEAPPADVAAEVSEPGAGEGAGERRQPRTRNRRRSEAAATAPEAAPAEAPAEVAGVETRGAETRGAETRGAETRGAEAREQGADTAEAGQRTDRRESGRTRGGRDSESAGGRDSRREDTRREDNRDDETEAGSRRNRRNRRDRNDRNERSDSRDSRDGNARNDRFRDRNDRRRGRSQGPDVDDIEVTDDDVLLPVAGILDVLENYAFIRTSGYLPGPNDVYVSLAQVKKYNLRKGDAVVGAIRAPRDGEDRGQQSARQKFNALVRVTSVNGKTSEELKDRVEFAKLVPLYPSERLRLETDPKKIGPRVIDLVAPIGKGQRGLIVSPPKAGKTLILQSIANAITTNNPEVHLMMVLVDERPEEVTDMQRTVKGEVIASTFDRPADDHTTVAELSIE